MFINYSTTNKWRIDINKELFIHPYLTNLFNSILSEKLNLNDEFQNRISIIQALKITPNKESGIESFYIHATSKYGGLNESRFDFVEIDFEDESKFAQVHAILKVESYDNENNDKSEKYFLIILPMKKFTKNNIDKLLPYDLYGYNTKTNSYQIVESTSILTLSLFIPCVHRSNGLNQFDQCQTYLNIRFWNISYQLIDIDYYNDEKVSTRLDTTASFKELKGIARINRLTKKIYEEINQSKEMLKEKKKILKGNKSQEIVEEDDVDSDYEDDNDNDEDSENSDEDNDCEEEDLADLEEEEEYQESLNNRRNEKKKKKRKL